MAEAASTAFDESEGVKLTENNAERKRLTALEDLFSIIQVTEHLETAFVGDLMKPAEYEAQCSKLIGHFENTVSMLTSSGMLSSVDDFMRDYAVEAPRARKRLLVDKVPATTLHKTGNAGGAAMAIAQVSINVVTFNDSIFTDQPVENLLPTLANLIRWLQQSPHVRSDWPHLLKAQAWQQKLATMAPPDILNARDKAQAQMDFQMLLDAYTALLHQ